MGRRGATYEARLEVLVNLCYRLSLEQGFINPKNLVNELNLSDRMIRTYVNDLLTLDVLQYQGDNKYAFNLSVVEEPAPLNTPSLIQPSILQRVLNKKSALTTSEPNLVQTKVEQIFTKMERVFRFPEALGDKVKTLKVADIDLSLLRQYRVDSILGDRLVQPLVHLPDPLEDFILMGSAATYKLDILRIYDFALMTISFLAASGVAMVFQKNKRDIRETYAITRPQIERFVRTEPFQRVDPFYDMYHDFPELLQAGRSIASRFLSEQLHIQTILDLLNSEWFEERKTNQAVPIIFKKGALSPHGFIVRGKTLSNLQKQTTKAFYELIGKVRKEGILLVGVTVHPRDDVFFKLSKNLLKADIGQMDDLNFFKQIMADLDVTCLIERVKEKSKPKLSQVYEFYTRQKQDVAKIEFYSVNNPLIEREQILRYLRPVFTLHPQKPREAGPSVTNQADVFAQEKLGTISDEITNAIHYGINHMLAKAQENFEVDLQRKYLEEE
ncbi:MAG: hypothetical protein ACFFFG_18340 [Candidatus Thorarchaeota archaeon]